MERNIKCKPINLCMIIFMFCLLVRFVEYFLIETDKTAIGENVLHKVVGIILLALVLKKINLTWGDIGFQKKRFCKRCFERLVIGKRVLCRFFWIGIRDFSPARQSRAFGNLYRQCFSLTGSQIKNTDFAFFRLCILFNVINVWMEEGVFRPYSSCGHRACLFYAYGKFLVHRSGSLFVFKNIMSCMGFGI